VPKSEAFESLLLLLATIVALLWANSPWVDAYEHLWASSITVGVSGFSLSEPLHFWVNEALMAIFFLTVGLEIRGEFLEGDLRSLKMAALPLAAALGGVVMPAVIYLLCNSDPLVRRGWAIPTATDIAFAIAVFAFLGRRVPSGLRALLLAIAVIDDIVAILVIAFFYADGIDASGLGLAAVGVVGGLLLRGLHPRWAILYVLPSVLIWVGLLRAGVHPALTGVVVGLLLPSSPAHWVERRMGPWVVFAIMPLFALANAGVTLHSLTLDVPVAVRLAGGIIAGLLVGKPIGIVLTAALGVRLGWADLPPGIDLRRFAVVGALGGIGFTMSLFVCNLAFSEEYLATAKLAVLVGSTLAALGGLLLGRSILRRAPSP
jgi:NhaA family Na+:H+ antiporter